MLQTIVDKFALSVASMATPAAPTARIGSSMPAASGDTPRLVVSLAIEDTTGTGLSRFTRAGDIPVRQNTVVTVAAGVDAFSGDLRTLRLAPLPIRQNPASPPGLFGPLDVSVANVSGATLIPYALVAVPVARAEFALDPVTAQIVFGAAQTPGDRLEVTHWTMQWRDDISTIRLRGPMYVDVCASDSTQVEAIARRLADNVFSGSATFRGNGFNQLNLRGLDPIESKVLQPGSGSPFSVWIQRLSCAFVFEYETGGEASEGVPIKQIVVNPGLLTRETMTIR